MPLWLTVLLIVIVWLALMVAAWAFVAGAARLRREEENSIATKNKEKI